MTTPRRWPMPDGGPGYITYPPGSAPPVGQVDDTGRGVYATGTVRLPVTVRCSRAGCGSAMSMPPGTPGNIQAIRLETAGWTRSPDGWVCRLDHTQAAAAADVAPTWARVSFAVGAYLVLLALMVWPVWLISGWTMTAVVNAVLVTVVWWGLVALRAAARRRRWPR